MDYSKGFVTLATGDDLYYKAAYRMLQSYRYQKGKYRFCILCDRENKYTRAFDDVILLKNCKFNYLDKFELLQHSPYQKNFFIEPDCLIYKNIDDFWDMFKNAPSLSAFGYNNGDLGFWFNNQKLIETTFGVKSIPIFNPGYLYIEKNDIVDNCYADLIKISKIVSDNPEFLSEEKIFNGKFLRDDPIFCLAMERNNCRCFVEQTIGKCIYLPALIDFIELKFSTSKLDVLYNLNGQSKIINDCYILHFSTRRTKEWLYFQQSLAVACVNNPFFSWFVKIIESKNFGFVLKKLFKLKSEIKSKFKKIH